MSNEKMAFVDKSRVERTIFFTEKISFSLKLFSGYFYGQSFIKTVRGPLTTYRVWYVIPVVIIAFYVPYFNQNWKRWYNNNLTI